MKDQFLFVYNANSDLFSTVTDFAHKILSPSTYDCHLCALTYGNLSMKQEWKDFIESLPIQAIILHKDEFEKQQKIKADFPAGYIAANGGITKIITKEEVNRCSTLEELKTLVTKKLEEYGQHNYSNIQ